MDFGNCFRLLCCTHGSGDMSLISGKMPNLQSMRLKKIRDRLSLNDMCQGFFDRMDSMGHDTASIEDPLESVRELLKLDDPSGRIKEIIACLDSDFYKVSEIQKAIQPLLFLSDEFKKNNVIGTLQRIEKDCVERGYFLGYFCFFDLENQLVNIVSAKKIKDSKLKVERSSRKFCIANLDMSIKDQDMNIAEGFCKSFNTILKRNKHPEFMVEIDS